jgi:hypothetical protein
VGPDQVSLDIGQAAEHSNQVDFSEGDNQCTEDMRNKVARAKLLRRNAWRAAFAQAIEGIGSAAPVPCALRAPTQSPAMALYRSHCCRDQRPVERESHSAQLEHRVDLLQHARVEDG